MDLSSTPPHGDDLERQAETAVAEGEDLLWQFDEVANPAPAPASQPVAPAPAPAPAPPSEPETAPTPPPVAPAPAPPVGVVEPHSHQVELADQIDRSLEWFGEHLVERWEHLLGEQLRDSVGSLQVLVQREVAAARKGIGELRAQLKTSITASSRQEQRIREELTAGRREVEELRSELEMGREAMEDLRLQLDELRSAEAPDNEPLEEVRGQIDELRGELEVSREALDEVRDQLNVLLESRSDRRIRDEVARVAEEVQALRRRIPVRGKPPSATIDRAQIDVIAERVVRSILDAIEMAPYPAGDAAPPPEPLLDADADPVDMEAEEHDEELVAEPPRRRRRR